MALRNRSTSWSQQYSQRRSALVPPIIARIAEMPYSRFRDRPEINAEEPRRSKRIFYPALLIRLAGLLERHPRSKKDKRMALVDKSESATNEIAILARILSNGKGFSMTLACQLLKMGFSDEDKGRMHELAVKNQEGRISPRTPRIG